MHAEAYAFLQAHATKAKTVLDVGGRNINGSPRSLYPDAAYTALDAVGGHGVDVVADIVDWDDGRTFDVVICAEVLEHAPNWRQILEECWLRVAPRGLLLVTCATKGREPHSAVDGGAVRAGEHYENVGARAFTNLLRSFSDRVEVEAHHDRGDIYGAVRRG